MENKEIHEKEMFEEDPELEQLKESGHNAPEARVFLPDSPVQLVRPDSSNHRKLVLIRENLHHLHHIEGAVAVVAVVGKFHSGKSFLLNQLMGKWNGFGIGPSVEPKTMGIWMWGKPLEVTNRNGKKLSLVFIDTEGFAASNISESYDAKIFAVATLLSSHLIYNSVKIIDQGDIDYLELLARGTRLFALKSQMTHFSEIDEFNHDLLTFPPLTWVVQDFHLSHTGGESPRDWLLRLMNSASRDDQYEIHLDGIFSEISCHTLFLPATKRDLLMDLSKVSEDELTPEYREERDTLRRELLDKVEPKEKNGRPIRGPEIASLLEILVDAANGGALAQIPGRWEAYLVNLKASAEQDCLAFYDNEMNVFLRAHDNDAVNGTELLEHHKLSADKAVDLLLQLLFELPNATKMASLSLKQAMSEKYDVTREMNEKLILIKCSDTQRRVELKAEEELERLAFPLKSTEVRQTIDDIKTSSLELYKSLVVHLMDSKAFKTYQSQLTVGLDRLGDVTVLRNNKALEEVLSNAIEQAVVKFREKVQNKNRVPRTTASFESMIEIARAEAQKVFEQESDMAKGESIFQMFEVSFEKRLVEERGLFWTDNLELTERDCRSKMSDVVGRFRDNTGPSKIVLPINGSELDSVLVSEKESSLRLYDQDQSSFADLPPFQIVRKALELEIDKICKQRREENVAAFARVVEGPLSTATKVIKLSASHYTTEFSAYLFMKEVCLTHLEEGQAASWSVELKEEIVTRHISESEDLQRILISKRSWWSSFVGFWQWLLWKLKIFS
jgi:hypothetical protein